MRRGRHGRELVVRILNGQQLCRWRVLAKTFLI
jgi:hypothetical protein